MRFAVCYHFAIKSGNFKPKILCLCGFSDFTCRSKNDLSSAGQKFLACARSYFLLLFLSNFPQIKLLFLLNFFNFFLLFFCYFSLKKQQIFSVIFLLFFSNFLNFFFYFFLKELKFFLEFFLKFTRNKTPTTHAVEPFERG